MAQTRKDKRGRVLRKGEVECNDVGIATFKGEGRRRREAFVRLFDLKSERYYVMSYQVNDME